MTIQEAIKSGKRYRLKHRETWLSERPVDLYHVSKDDLLSLDWEIEEDKIELSKTQIIRAIAKIAKERATERRSVLEFLGPYGSEPIDSSYGIQLLLEKHGSFLKELGFP